MIGVGSEVVLTTNANGTSDASGTLPYTVLLCIQNVFNLAEMLRAICFLSQV